MSLVHSVKVLFGEVFQAVHRAFFQEFLYKRIFDIRKVKSVCQISVFNSCIYALFVYRFFSRKVLLVRNYWVLLGLHLLGEPFVELIPKVYRNGKIIVEYWYRGLIRTTFGHITLAFFRNFLSLNWSLDVEYIAVFLELGCP